MAPSDTLDRRRARLARARLYLVTDSAPERGLRELLCSALAGGADLVQLRDKDAGDDAVLAAAPAFRELCAEHGALFVVNDDPALALAAGADAVHVGQDDMPVARAREESGGDLLVGLSTHSPAQFDAGMRSGADYLCAGPVFATPTKPGRPATGWELIRHAARAAPADLPWFAIGGIDEGNVGAAAAAGATRAVVVRAVRDAPDPRAAASALRTELETWEAGVGAAAQ